MATFKISGSVIDGATRKGIADLRAEAWVHITGAEKQLGVTTTDAEGHFGIEFNMPDRQLSRQPLGVIKIFSGDTLLHTTAEEPIAEWAPQPPHVVIQLKSTPETPQTEPDEQWRVMGHVTKANGEPVSAVVNAVNVKLNDKEPLGQVQTDNGVYVIIYQPEVKEAPESGCKLPDLLVQAYQNDVLIASSDIIYNAEKVTAIDLVVNNEVYKGPSEYQKLEQTLRPCLGDRDPATLNTEDVEYLVKKTGANQEWIVIYVVAHRQGKVTEAAPPLFYACFRKQLPYGLDKLIMQRPQAIKSRIQAAIDENIIEDKWKTEAEAFISLLKNASIKSALTIDKTSTKTSLGKVFTQINIPAKSQVTVLNLYVEHQEDTPAFWKALSKHKTLGQYEDQLRLVLKVSALTQHYEPATKALMNLGVKSTFDFYKILPKVKRRLDP